jgi:hypothetical protein
MAKVLIRYNFINPIPDSFPPRIALGSATINVAFFPALSSTVEYMVGDMEVGPSSTLPFGPMT